MIIELEPIFNNIGAEKTFSYEMSLADEELYGEKPFQTPIVVEGSVKNSTGIVKLKATADFVFYGSCDRCATDLQSKITIPVEHILVATLNNSEDGSFILVENMRLDLDELVTEDIFLELPSKQLCKEDCKGLCTFCGQNLNEGQCSCKKPIDPRLEALSRLLDE